MYDHYWLTEHQLERIKPYFPLPVPPINSDRHRNPGVFGAPATGFAGAPKDVQLMTRRGDLKLSHGATAKVRENAVKQDRVRVTNAIGHHPERSGFLRRTEFIGGTASFRSWTSGHGASNQPPANDNGDGDGGLGRKGGRTIPIDAFPSVTTMSEKSSVIQLPQFVP